MIVLTSQEMREVDRLTIERNGVAGIILMERAGELTTRALMDAFPHARKGSVLVLAGKGNNGGDGLVVSRKLTEAGYACRVLLCGRSEDLSLDAKANLDRYARMGGEVIEAGDLSRYTGMGQQLESSVLVVDAILGTGLRAPLKGPFAYLIEAVNASGIPVVAVDIPSGLHSDLGVPFDVCIQAELTVTFGYPKLGQVIFPGARLCGQLVVADIGLSERAVQEIAPCRSLMERDDVTPWFQRREPDSHKGNFGHLLVVGGSRGKTGAAVLAARAAMRVGAGLVTLAVPRSTQALAAGLVPEVMTEGLPDDGDGSFSLSASEEVERVLNGKDGVVVGPGIGTTEGACRLTRRLMEENQVPVLYDADALNCLARDLASGLSLQAVFGRSLQKRILTPHPGEMGRLAAIGSGEVQRSRVQVVEGFARDSGAVVVLKGARTITATPDGMLLINPTGNPGMASGGMGDVLSGVIGGLLVQGLEAAQASAAGVYLHGAAGDRVCKRMGEMGMIATDVIDELPRTILSLQRRDHG